MDEEEIKVRRKPGRKPSGLTRKELAQRWRDRNREQYKEYQRAYQVELRENKGWKLREYYETQVARGNVKSTANYKYREVKDDRNK